jgi:TRAP-type C4-dicarboxylate transport system substrate-binding protein
MPIKRLVLLVVYACIALGCGIGIFRASVTQAEFTIKASIQASTQDEDYVGLLAFKKYVEENSNGRVQVQLTPLANFAAACLNVSAVYNPVF